MMAMTDILMIVMNGMTTIQRARDSHDNTAMTAILMTDQAVMTAILLIVRRRVTDNSYDSYDHYDI